MNLYSCWFEALLGLDLIIGLFAGLEGQWFGELNRDSAQEAIYALNSANVTRSGEIRHIEGLLGTVMGNTETSSNVLTGVRAAVF